MKTIITFTVLLMLVACAGQKESSSSKQTVKIQTNAECGTCKTIIEKELNYLKGVVFAELDVPSKVLTVKFNSAKISLDDIRKKVSEIGYDADDVKANTDAQSNLPKCCQPGGMGK